MKATVKQIYDYIEMLNPTVSIVSSLGSFVSATSESLSYSVSNEVARALINKESLAYKILSTTTRFSVKQLWVIAYELVKNEEFAERIGEFYAEINRKENAKKRASNAKLAANKQASQSVLDFVKSNGRKLGDYYNFIKSNKQFAREFYSKKYTMTSAEAFLA